MRPRTILYTGKGGVGKTSVAAATARRCAAAGARTLVVSTDPAHSLADVLDAPVERRPTAVAPHLHAQQVQAQDEMEAHWSAVSDWFGTLLMERGTDRIAAEELTVPPGGDELFSLLVLKGHVESGEYDVIVVDCAPTGETLRLLSFPDAARWWLDKVLGKEQTMLNAARPLARMFLDVQLPDEKVIAEVQRLVGNLVAMHELLRDTTRVSMRLVMTPDRMVVAEAMRTFTYLNLYGYLTDAVIVNRVFPDELAEGYFGAWHAAQRDQLERVGAGFSPVPVLHAPYFAHEVIGTARLDELADALFTQHEPAAVLHDRLAQRLSVNNGHATLELDLPFATKGDIQLKKIGLELIVRVDAHKRTIVLPGALAGYKPTSATLEEGALTVQFEGNAAPPPHPDHPTSSYV
ncbi:ArsA family ATPase [Solirubrobacter sp. CPCC 204708]|uniref:ArsA family ATPase n=1 Tax=Solirubrobacter deserti TaxID=2282478 RepID=A0ABT4RPV1_9ACTN|nr:ArsA family ATPase [Solirubrobacter deserti]MBE2318253.1 ArsA family ATPase [Solirubrobacter deserti]MDA0140591.1 ArsA family ATPase [Solirubrobacter deserti]